MAEEELEARIRIAMPPLQRLGDILLTQHVEFDAGAVATSLAQLHRNEQLRVPVADPAVAGPDQTRQGLHGTSYAAALRIIQEGFVGRVCHGRISRITGRQEELVYCHTKRTGDKAWQYCNDTRPLAPSLPLLHVCIECAIPAGYAHWKNNGGQTAWLPDQVTPLAFVFKAIEGPPRLTVAVAADAEAANAKDAAEEATYAEEALEETAEEAAAKSAAKASEYQVTNGEEQAPEAKLPTTSESPQANDSSWGQGSSSWGSSSHQSGWCLSRWQDEAWHGKDDNDGTCDTGDNGSAGRVEMVDTWEMQEDEEVKEEYAGNDVPVVVDVIAMDARDADAQPGVGDGGDPAIVAELKEFSSIAPVVMYKRVQCHLDLIS